MPFLPQPAESALLLLPHYAGTYVGGSRKKAKHSQSA